MIGIGHNIWTPNLYVDGGSDPYAEFEISSLTSYALWDWVADLGVATDPVTGRVSQWTDQLQGLGMLQSTDADQPAVTAGPGGHDAISGDGLSRFLRSMAFAASLITGDACSVFTVRRRVAGTGSADFVYDYSTPTGSQQVAEYHDSVNRPYSRYIGNVGISSHRDSSVAINVWRVFHNRVDIGAAGGFEAVGLYDTSVTAFDTLVSGGDNTNSSFADGELTCFATNSVTGTAFFSPVDLARLIVCDVVPVPERAAVATEIAMLYGGLP